jgi:hypothetical protein
VRNQTLRVRGGAVVQAGLDVRHTPERRELMLGVYRAVVINTYTQENSANFRGVDVECDVILTSSLSGLSRVPVAQQNHGVNNLHGLWVPKPSTRSVTTGLPLRLVGQTRRGAFLGPTTAYDDLDGDLVGVEFVEGSRQHPIITRSLTHEQTKRLVVSGSGWAEVELTSSRGTPHSDEYYVHHQGTEVRVNAAGDVLVDTVGAHSDPVLELPATGRGQVRIRVKSTERFTVEMDGEDVLEVWKDVITGDVHVDLGEGATEHIVLGDAFKILYDAHVHGSAIGPTGDPTIKMDVPPGTHLSTEHRVK